MLFSVDAGERPITRPPSDLAPLAAQKGNPVVAPVTKTELWRIISLPNSSPIAKKSGPQWPVSAAGNANFIFICCMTNRNILIIHNLFIIA